MSTNSTSLVSEAFETALAGFKRRLTDKELKDFEGTRVEDIKYEIQRIQDGHENLKQNMNMNRIKSFLEAMEQFGKILDVFLNASQFVAFVWGPLKFMLMVGKLPAFSNLQAAFFMTVCRLRALSMLTSSLLGVPQLCGGFRNTTRCLRTHWRTYAILEAI